MNPQRVAGLVPQTISCPDESCFAKDLRDSMGQRVEDGAIDSRPLHRNLLKSEAGTISYQARLNSTTFKVHNSIDQRLELLTLLRRNTHDTSRLDTNHTTFGTLGGRREAVENGVDLVTLADPNVCEVGEQDGLWGRFLRPQRRKTFVLDSCLSLAFEVGSLRNHQSGHRFGNYAGTDELRNPIDENLSRRCTEGERVAVPKDDI